MQSCEIKVVQRGDLSGLARLEVMPTICLLAFQTSANGLELDLLAKASLAIGTRQFAMYGPPADELEDEVDFILEQGPQSWLDVATTAHGEESPPDVANFLVHASYPDAGHFRCLVILDDQFPQGGALLRELTSESAP